MSLELGAVFKTAWSADPIRVIAFDSSVVMYDTWWPHRSAWGMAKLSGTFSYYRLPRPLFDEKSEFLRVEPYSSDESNVHRPDLPFSFAQHTSLSWYSGSLPKISQVALRLGSASRSGVQPVLKVASIYLAPFGPKDGAKTASLIHAEDGMAISEPEVLSQAWQLQKPLLGDQRLTEGIGIYRSGVRRRIPSHYIWGSRSRLEGESSDGT